MKQIYFLLFLIGYTPSSHAQQANMHLFPSANTSFLQPTAIGMVGEHYMIYDHRNGWPSFIYTFDSTFKPINTTQEYISEKLVNFRISGNTLNLIWRSWVKDSLHISFARLDEWGNNKLFFRNSYYFPRKNASDPKLVSDDGNNYFLYYSLVTDSADQQYLRMVLFDTTGNERRSGSYRIAYDRSLYVLTEPVVDANGNIHFATYDKLGNYHLSATVTIYTVPIQKDTLLVAATELNKLKFKDLSLLDDRAAGQVKLTGYYYDGQERVKKGIASLQLSYTGTGNIKTAFYPFPDELAGILHAGLRNETKKDNPVENLIMKEIFEQDGKIFVGNWLKDQPGYTLTKDKDQDNELHTIRQKKTDPARAVTSVAQNPDVHNLLDNTPITPRYDNNPNLRFNIPKPDRFIPLEEVQVPTPGTLYDPDDPKQISYLQTPEARFLFYFSIDKNGIYSYAMLSNTSDRFAISELNNYPLVHRGRLSFLNVYPRPVKEGKTQTLQPRVSVATYDSKGLSVTLADYDASNMLFYTPTEIAPGRYISPYRNTDSGQSGIALWSIQNTNDNIGTPPNR